MVVMAGNVKDKYREKYCILFAEKKTDSLELVVWTRRKLCVLRKRTFSRNDGRKQFKRTNKKKRSEMNKKR